MGQGTGCDKGSQSAPRRSNTPQVRRIGVVRGTQIRHSVRGELEVRSVWSGALGGGTTGLGGSAKDRGGVVCTAAVAGSETRDRPFADGLLEPRRGLLARYVKPLGNSQVPRRWPAWARGSRAAEPCALAPRADSLRERTPSYPCIRVARLCHSPRADTRSKVETWSTAEPVEAEPGVERPRQCRGDTAAVSAISPQPRSARASSYRLNGPLRPAGRRRSNARPLHDASGRRHPGRRRARSGR